MTREKLAARRYDNRLTLGCQHSTRYFTPLGGNKYKKPPACRLKLLNVITAGKGAAARFHSTMYSVSAGDFVHMTRTARLTIETARLMVETARHDSFADYSDRSSR